MGFAAETNELLKNASKKLQEKDADYIIANDVSQNVFGNDQDQVTILSRHNTPKKLKKMSKNEVAKYLVNIIVQEFDK